MGVTKTVIKPGQAGALPKKGQAVTVHCTGACAAGRGEGGRMGGAAAAAAAQALTLTARARPLAAAAARNPLGYGKNNNLKEKFWSTKDPGQQVRGPARVRRAARRQRRRWRRR